MIYGTCQQHDRLDRIAISMMLKAPLGMIAMILAMALWGSVTIGCLAVAAARAIVLLCYDVPCVLGLSQRAAKPAGGWRLRPSVGPIWDLRRMGSLTLLALPLGFSTLLVALNINIPRYFISGQLSAAQLGITPR